MAKQIAFLEYSFIFDPVNTWQHGSDFERDLSKFFKAFGMNAEIIETRGGTNRRVIWITPMNKLDRMASQPPKKKIGRPQTLKGRFKELSSKRISAAERDFKIKKKKHSKILDNR